MDYYNWLCNIIKPLNGETYNQLLKFLFDTDFVYIIEMDVNRYIDGIDLRNRFIYETNMPIEPFYNDKKCSVLEMMVALSIACEERIMGNTKYGDRTSEWFWNMIDNLGLINLYDGNYDEDVATNKILTFLNREYSPNGFGGLFTVDDSFGDIRNVDIWYQLLYYFNGRLKGIYY